MFCEKAKPDSNGLITYRTITQQLFDGLGSIRGVSEAIGKTLSELGKYVDIMPMHDVKDLSQYKAVIAGSAIQI